MNNSQRARALGVTGALTTALLCSSNVSAKMMDQFTDPEDGRIDASQFILDNSTGFLPIPIMVTDPAVGVGGGAALLFFHESEDRKQKRLAGEEVADIPSSASGLVGLATSNGTQVYGGFHSGNWFNDNVRYLGGLFKADVNLDYNLVGDVATTVKSDAIYFFQDIDVRLGNSNFFAGGVLTYMNTKNAFPDFEQILPSGIAQQISDGDIALKLTYDSRNNQMAPTSGTKAGAKVNFHSVDYHQQSDRNLDHYQKYHVFAHHYQPINDDWRVALRADAKRVDGDYTFYSRPFIDLRGIAAMSIQGSNTALAEVEVSYDIDDRWTALGFTGAGSAFEDHEDISKSQWHQTVGGGIRYLIARQLGLTTGIDIAKGPKENAIYLQFGGAW